MTHPMDSWKLRINRAKAAAVGLKVEAFHPTLSASDPHNALYTEHAGQAVEIIDFIIEPVNLPHGYDEEALPVAVGRFTDGIELGLFLEELVTTHPALRELISAVSSGFAVAREMGYVGPYDLMERATEDEQRLFSSQVERFNIDWDERDFVTPPQEPQVGQAASDPWCTRPTLCPYCAGSEVQEIAQWSAQSIEDPGNTCVIAEYQCQGACEGRSFWS